MRTYKEQLEKEYKAVQIEHKIDHPEDGLSRLHFLGDYVFEFTTYDPAMYESFARRMLEVIEAILGDNADYIKTPTKYENYLLMINMPFLVEKIEWGSSIRSAFLDDSKAYDIGRDILNVRQFELKSFMRDLIDFGNENNN